MREGGASNLARRLELHEAVGMLVARLANGPREGQDLAGVVAAPAVMRERDRGSEREQRQQGRRRERGSHRSPPGASRPTEVNCPSPRGVKPPARPPRFARRWRLE